MQNLILGPVSAAMFGVLSIEYGQAYFKVTIEGMGTTHVFSSEPGGDYSLPEESTHSLLCDVGCQVHYCCK